jgi:TonB family protein
MIDPSQDERLVFMMVMRQQGVPYIRFVIDWEGNVLSVRLERSSGVAVLDREAVALPKRAQPLPKPPEDRPGDTIELVAPVEFLLRRRSRGLKIVTRPPHLSCLLPLLSHLAWKDMTNSDEV